MSRNRSNAVLPLGSADGHPQRRLLFQSKVYRTIMSALEKPLPMKAADAYNAAADHFDAEPLGFWSRHGARTVELMQLVRGARVLDVGCGTGSSALPAAQRVGPEGTVLGIDIAHNMVFRAQAKARARGLDNVQFECLDMADLVFPDGAFDAVIGVFSIFFVDDMEAQIARLWRMLAPGGKLALAVWDKTMLEPVAPMLKDEVRRVRPDVSMPQKPWQRLTDRTLCRAMFHDLGIGDVTFHAVRDRQPLLTPADGWTIALGSGLRWEIEQLSAHDRQLVRSRLLARLGTADVTAVDTDAIVAIARKPSNEA